MKQYHTFWQRTGALFLDGLALSPLTVAPIVIMAVSHVINFSTCLTLVTACYVIILPARHGQTAWKDGDRL